MPACAGREERLPEPEGPSFDACGCTYRKQAAHRFEPLLLCLGRCDAVVFGNRLGEVTGPRMRTGPLRKKRRRRVTHVERRQLLAVQVQDADGGRAAIVDTHGQDLLVGAEEGSLSKSAERRGAAVRGVADNIIDQMIAAMLCGAEAAMTVVDPNDPAVCGQSLQGGGEFADG